MCFKKSLTTKEHKRGIECYLNIVPIVLQKKWKPQKNTKGELRANQLLYLLCFK